MSAIIGLSWFHYVDPIGGNVVEVEMDKTLIVHYKYNRGSSSKTIMIVGWNWKINQTSDGDSIKFIWWVKKWIHPALSARTVVYADCTFAVRPGYDTKPSEALGNVEYPLIAITPRCTLARIGSTC